MDVKDEENEIPENEEEEDKTEEFESKNCHKCHKASYKYRKVDFCGKCITNGLVKIQDSDKNLHCKKCKKSKFRQKNEDYCEKKCPKYTMKETESDEDSIGSLGSQIELEEELTTMSPTSEVDSEGYKLGPLGSLLKFLVVSNTWGEASATASTQSETSEE